MHILALIPARGGSKSIPGKNLLSIAGKPLIAHTIGHALGSKHITRAIVSTDDPTISEVAQRYGAEVPFLRPTELAQDLSTDFEVFHHALTWLQENENYECDLVVHLRPPRPIRSPHIIDNAIESILACPEADSLRSVCTPIQTPYKMWQIESGFLKPIMTLSEIPESYCLPRQSLPQVYWQNGYVDIARASTILKKKKMCGERILPFFVDAGLEIDYPEDVPRVESLLLGQSTFQREERHAV